MNIGVTDSTKFDSKAHIIVATEVPLDRDDLKKTKVKYSSVLFAEEIHGLKKILK